MGETTAPRLWRTAAEEAGDGDPVKVRMLVHIGGARNGALWPPAGRTLTVPRHEADDLIMNGYAVRDGASDDDVAAAQRRRERKGNETHAVR